MHKFLSNEAIAANLDFTSEEHKFEIPTKKINTMEDLAKFQTCAQNMDLSMFIIET